MNLTHLFDLSLIGRRDAAALEVQGKTYTFGEIDERSNRIARLLAQHGLDAGDRLCVYLCNSVEMVDLYLACVKLGVIFVPINILYREREITHIVTDAEPKAVVAKGDVPGLPAAAGLRATPVTPAATDRPALSGMRTTSGPSPVPELSAGLRLPTGPARLASALPASPGPAVAIRPPASTLPAVWQVEELEKEAAKMPGDRVAMTLDGDAPAAIVYTSGTTGTSKGAVLTHNNFAANAVNLISCWQISSADRLLLPLPLFHVHGLGNGLHTWLIAGYRMRLQERFERERTVAEFLDFEPTLFFGVPTIYVRLLKTPPDVARSMAQHMRLFVSGSAPLPAQVLEEFHGRFGHRILERYGMSETLMNISNPYTGERRPGSVGLPLPGVSIRLLDESGQPVADGETGEIHLRGPNVFGGYWRREDATRAAFVDGWFRTGDLAARSPDGYYTLHGRRSDLIISGGFNIYPREIEEFLLEQEAVAEAAVVGVPDRARGEVPVAYVVPRGPIDAAALEKRCREKLASFKVPRAFVTVEKLPRTALGKVQKHLLPKWEPR